MKPCGVAYWLITVAQIPIAVAFTACIVSQKRKLQTRNSQVAELAIAMKSRLDALPVYVFPVAALLTGVMSGLFGIGGGLLLNPVLLQIGVPPKTASATTMFMVLFCASMSICPVHNPGSSRDRGRVGLRRGLLHSFHRRAGRDRGRHQEVWKGFAHRPNGRRRPGPQRRRHSLLRRSSRLGAVHERAVHGFQAPLLKETADILTAASLLRCKLLRQSENIVFPENLLGS
ncbi:hypothetical protein QYE76_007863 [Lolium multiflorum]|uniref:Uncharacterized protein n=1 Tax=Lolium multiflorum TaxID=4521 RepID=A0AAD8QH86_LOLMU|nr:hypothetical protein QYE76_007863 [Lolium multiflorum]